MLITNTMSVQHYQLPLVHKPHKSPKKAVKLRLLVKLMPIRRLAATEKVLGATKLANRKGLVDNLHYMHFIFLSNIAIQYLRFEYSNIINWHFKYLNICTQACQQEVSRG